MAEHERTPRSSGDMHVVLISYFYPPDPAVGGLRAQKVAHALLDRGHRVTVITGRLPDDAEARREKRDGLTIRAIESMPGLRDLYQRLRRRERASAPAEPAIPMDDTSWSPPEETGKWKRRVTSLFWLPDDRQGFVFPAARAAVEAIRSGAQWLYTTGPPFSVHLAGLVANRRTGVRWACEFRDPWSANTWKPPFVRSAFSDWADGWLEQRCLRRATSVVGVSQGLQRILQSLVPPDRRDRVVVVRNGIERLPASAPAAPAAPPTIVYAGTLYLSRNPEPFLRGLAHLVEREPGLRGQVAAEFIGDCRWYNGASVEALVRQLGLDGMVAFRDWLAHDEAQARLGRAAALLLLARDQPDQVPNKLYDYLAAQRPILAFVGEGDESAQLLREAGQHHLVPDDSPERIADAIRAVLDQYESGSPFTVNDAALRQWTTERQMDKLCTLLQDHP